MNNEIIISNVNPQDIIIGEGGATGITDVLVNDVSVVENNIAYVVVPTKLSELQNDTHYITQETDPTVPYVVKQITNADIIRWNSKQDQLLSGVNIKTINNTSILGEGNINVDKTYTAGTGINITDENVINNTITSYNDLNDLPTIPTKISDLQNDSDFVESSELSNVAFSGSYLDLSNTPDLSIYATLDTNELLNYYTKDFFFNILPKSTGSGAYITLNDTIDNVQMYLSLGASELSQDGTPTPSSPQAVHTISGSNKVKVKKELFNIQDFESQLVSGKILNNSGEEVSDGSSTYSKYKIQLIANETYVIKGAFQRIYYYDNNGNFVSRGNASNTGIDTTYTPSNDEYIGFQIINTYWRDNKGNETIYCLTDGSSQEAEVDLDTLEYCKIGSYEDKFIRSNDGTWQLEKNIGKVEITTFNNKSGATANNQFSTSVISNILKPSAGTITSSILSNRFTSYSPNYIYGHDIEAIGINTDGSITVGLGLSSGINTLELANQWLGNNQTYAYYPLATPTYTQITGTLETQLENIYQKLLSYTGTTNISQVNNDLPFIISATTLKDMSNL